MDLKLKGRKALITGGSQGVGLGIARALVAEGCDVAIGARGEETLGKVVEELNASTGQAIGIKADFSIEEECQNFVTKAAEALGGIDILVNNVGGMSPGNLEGLTSKAWRSIIDRNMFSAIFTTRAAVPYIKNSDQGSILNITGISGRQLLPGSYTTTVPNAAITGFSKQVANELSKYGVTVNCLSPGSVATESWKERAVSMAKLKGTTPEAVLQELAALSMFNRSADISEIGAVAAFLVSGQNRFMTGSTVDVCGGASKFI